MNEERQKLIMEMIALGVLINDETEYCVFIRFFGHVDSFEVEIAKDKTQYNERVCETEIENNTRKWIDETPDDHLNYLKATRDTLKSILENHEIPYEMMKVHIEEVRTYTF